MKRLWVAAAAGVLALLTWIQFPGHTWLQQDSQIYAPILENMRDPTVLRNDILVQQPHVAYTLYDEAAVALQALTGLSFGTVLAIQQIVTRALGIWGLFLLAQAFGLPLAGALLVAMIVSLGARIAGPEVLTFEYEPTPRAFAMPLLFCAMGLTAHRRYMPAGIAAAVAFLYHPPTALPFWIAFAVILTVRRDYRPLAPLAIAAIIIAVMAQMQGGGAAGLFERLTATQEQLQRMRTPYVWISTWPWNRIVHHLLIGAIVIAAFIRLRHQMTLDLRVILGGLSILGLASMPASWLLLEQWKLSLAPQIQPLRALLFVTLTMQLLTAAAGYHAVKRRRWPEACVWFAFAYLPPLQPVMTDPYTVRRVAVVAALAALTVAARRFAPAIALAGFFMIPTLGGIRNYPKLHAPEMAHLSTWARTSTPLDAVFLFADAGRSLQPGIFRSEALRAVYVDWKGGGQVNYLKDFADQWWFRWRQTVAEGFKPEDVPKYSALGIRYIVLQPGNRLPAPPQFENAAYVAYRVP